MCVLITYMELKADLNVEEMIFDFCDVNMTQHREERAHNLL